MFDDKGKVYSGIKLLSGNLVFKRSLPDGIQHDLKPYESAKMLPDSKGFNWGYQENCQQLALALLLDVCHKPEISLVYSKDFAKDYVQWFKDEWKLNSEIIELWLEDKLYAKNITDVLEMVYQN